MEVLDKTSDAGKIVGKIGYELERSMRTTETPAWTCASISKDLCKLRIGCRDESEYPFTCIIQGLTRGKKFLHLLKRSLPTHRPSHHRPHRCDCPSTWDPIEATGRIQPVSSKELNMLLQLLSCHFNAHPTFPGENGIRRTAEQIHANASREAYAWCYVKGYFRLWAYLWVHWSWPKKWKLGASG